MKESVTDVIQGAVIGASMAVPGISGGSMAIILGIYDKLISAVSGIFSSPKKNTLYLLRFGAGAAAGIVLIAGAVSAALGSPAGLPLRFFFLGAVAGGIPMIFRKARLSRLSPSGALLILAGAAAVLLLGLLPAGLFSPEKDGAAAWLFQFAGGIILAAALVLPGISCSHMMYMLGIYENIAEKLSRLELLPLVPLFAGVLAGTFLTARTLEKLTERHERACYLVILGFMTGSLYELIPHAAFVRQWVVGIVCAAAGFIAAKTLCANEKADIRPHS